MDDNFKEQSNNDIQLAIKQMEYDYEAIKRRMLKDLDNLFLIEKMCDKAAKILSERINGKNNIYK
tara:strand:+ start:4613 stop:4807 length:195 start_codon:yes stop_codon:yes gene_type:complete